MPSQDSLDYVASQIPLLLGHHACRRGKIMRREVEGPGHSHFTGQKSAPQPHQSAREAVRGDGALSLERRVNRVDEALANLCHSENDKVEGTASFIT